MFIDKLIALIGEVPAQFEPLMYVMAVVAFLWLLDHFMYLCRYMVSGGK